MICLAIDVSGRAMSAALAEASPAGPRCKGQSCLDTGKNHSLALLPMVDSLLENCGIKLSDVDGFAVTVGPGSFTGLRIGLATVKAWCDALDKPAIAVGSTDAMARAIDRPGLVCPVFDARRSEVYAALFRDGERLTPDLAVSPEELCRKLDAYDGPIAFGGDGLDPWEEVFRTHLGDRFRAIAPERRLNMASAAALIGLEKLEKGDTVDASSLVPVYLRLSEAEEKLQQKQAQAAE